MCFVGFVYFDCGHSRIIFQDCELANQADIPFWNRELCPNHHSASERPNYPCGQGKFYCSESADGQLLDLACFQAKEAASRLVHINALLLQGQGAAGALVARMNAAGLPQQQRDRHPLAVQLSARHANLTSQKLALLKKRSDANTLLQQAQEWYKNRLQHQADQQSRLFPPFVPGLDVYGKNPAKMISTQSADVLSSETGYIGIPILGSEHQQSMANVQQRNLAVSTRAMIAMSQERGHRGSGGGLGGLHHLAQQAEVEGRRLVSRAVQPPQAAERSPAHSKRGAGSDLAKKASKRRAAAKEADDLGGDEGSIRRSARVRGRKINYAESFGSVSRETSPDKSGGFGPSPEKSEVSNLADADDVDDDIESPVKRGCGRTRKQAVSARAAPSSLSERLNDYVKRTAAARASPVSQTPSGIQTANLTAKGAGNDLAAPPYLPPIAQMIASTEDSTRSLLPQPPLAPLLSTHQERRQEDRPPTGPGQRLSFDDGGGLFASGTAYGVSRPTLQPPLYMPPSTPAGMPRVNPQDSMSAPTFPVTGVLRRDSFDSGTFPMATPNSEQAASYYEGMRRSFGTPTALTPTVNASPEVALTDPRKRSLPPPSPALQSAKRMRLSLPGGGATVYAAPNDWPLGQPAELSSPEKDSIQGSPGKGGPKLPSPQSMLAGSDIPAPMPAPSLRPTQIRPPQMIVDGTPQGAAGIAEGPAFGNDGNEAA